MARPRVFEILRHVVRELAAAVYVYIAFAFLARWVAGSPWSALALEVALVFAGAAILTALVEAPLAATAFVGLFVSAFDAGLALFGGAWAEPRAFLANAGVRTAVLTLAGVVAALLVRRRRARKASSQGTSDGPAEPSGGA